MPRPLPRLCFALLAAIACGAAPRGARAAEQATPNLTFHAAPSARLLLQVDRTAVVSSKRPCTRVSIAQPGIADVNLLAPQEILVTGKAPGVTQLAMWTDDGALELIDVAVELDLGPLASELKAAFPDEPIHATRLGESVVLRGQIGSTDAAQRAVEVASAYAPGVVNLLQVSGGQQVMLRVRFMEVSRTAIRALGVNITAGVANADFSIVAGSVPGRLTAAERAWTLAGSVDTGDFTLDAFIDALERNNLARVLAEPNLTAMSGREGTFLLGGQFPVPVPQSGTGAATTITIEYKEFGTRLRFLPVVVAPGRIRLTVAPEVSDLDFTNAVSVGGVAVPSLRTRRVETTVELEEGQTFAIAGLINTRIDARRNGTPVLADLPWLGTLFRSTRYERQETELVVLVTPELVAGMNPGDVPPLPGEAWREPGDVELYLQGDVGGPVPAYFGAHGFVPAPSHAGGASGEKVD